MHGRTPLHAEATRGPLDSSRLYPREYRPRLQLTVSDDGPWTQIIDGPSARMLDMGDDAVMGFILWCSQRGPETLEGFQYGDAAGNTVDLHTFDLEMLRFSEIA